MPRERAGGTGRSSDNTCTGCYPAPADASSGAGAARADAPNRAAITTLILTACIADFYIGANTEETYAFALIFSDKVPRSNNAHSEGR